MFHPKLLDLSRTMDIGSMNVSFASEHAQVTAEVSAAHESAASAQNMTHHVELQVGGYMEKEY